MTSVSAAACREPAGLLRLPAVVALAAVTAVPAQVLVSGVVPSAGVLLSGLLLATAVAALLAPRRPLAGLLGAQLAVHVVFALTQPAGCLRTVGRAASAGWDLAWWGAASVCGPGDLVVGAPQQLAATVLLSAVPLLLGQALVTSAGAAWVSRLDALVARALSVLGAVLARVPRVAPLPATRPLPAAVTSDVVLPDSLAVVRALVRRGPPAVLAA